MTKWVGYDFISNPDAIWEPTSLGPRRVRALSDLA